MKLSLPPKLMVFSSFRPPLNANVFIAGFFEKFLTLLITLTIIILREFGGGLIVINRINIMLLKR
jgi:hypothetical protein